MMPAATQPILVGDTAMQEVTPPKQAMYTPGTRVIDRRTEVSRETHSRHLQARWARPEPADGVSDASPVD